MERTQKKVVVDFIKAFSCAYSVTKNLSEHLEVEIDPVLLRSVVGFSSGISTMGDTCGVVNGGVAVLGKKFSDLPSERLYLLCAEYFRRLEERVATPNCGVVHGGKHLASDFRRAILTGKTMKCVEVLAHGARVLEEMDDLARRDDFSFCEPERADCVGASCRCFERECFHCCQNVISGVAESLDIAVEHIFNPSRGFIGGIGFNGTVCGAVSGGVLCLGLESGVDLGGSGYSDAMGIVFHGLLKSGKIFQDEKRFRPAKLFERCKNVYQTVEREFGHAHCRDILGVKLDEPGGCERYEDERKIDLCRDVVRVVIEAVRRAGQRPL
jgi:C_GCAxxG_C_C family probable redox protein